MQLLLKIACGIASAAALLAGCAGLALTPAELNAHADQYDGKEVWVSGWLVYQFEDIGIWDSKSAHDESVSLTLNSRTPHYPPSCISYSGPSLGEHFSNRAVLLRGIFRKEILPPNVFSNGICNRSGLEVESLPKAPAVQ